MNGQRICKRLADLIWILVRGAGTEQLFWKVAVQKKSISEKASLIDNLNWKVYSERELLCITAILEPIVKTYEESLCVIQKPLNYR